MSVETTMTCDGCGELIIGDHGWPRNDYVALVPAGKPMPPTPEGGWVVAGVAVPPVLRRSYQFHNLKCLRTALEAHTVS